MPTLKQRNGGMKGGTKYHGAMTAKGPKGVKGGGSNGKGHGYSRKGSHSKGMKKGY